jgi:hypothetical protein
MRNEEREIAALRPGKSVSPFRAPHGRGRVFYGQLVAVEELPLRGTVTVIEGAADGRVVDTDGSGFSRSRRVRGITPSRVRQSRAAQVVFPIAHGHEDPSGLRIVRLAQASSVCAFVYDRNGAPVEGASVELRCSYSRLVQATSLLIDVTSKDDRVWRGRTDSTGRATIEDLPSVVPLLVSVSKSGFPRHDQPGPIRLEIKQHELDVLLGGEQRSSARSGRDGPDPPTLHVADAGGGSGSCVPRLLHRRGDGRRRRRPTTTVDRFAAVPTGVVVGPARRLLRHSARGAARDRHGRTGRDGDRRASRARPVPPRSSPRCHGFPVGGGLVSPPT